MIMGKLQIPYLGQGIVERIRLLTKMKSFNKKKLTCVVAPAGYGKTVFVKQFVDSTALPFVWYQLDTFDNDPIQFFQYIISGISKAIPGLQVNLPEFNPEDSKSERKFYNIIAAVVSELEKKADKGLIIVLDDFHLVNETEILRFTEYFLNYLPGTVHIVISSRQRPDLRLLRLKASESVIEINQQDLEFSQAEATKLLRSESGICPEEEFIKSVHRKLNGWALGLKSIKLAIESSAGKPKETAFLEARNEIFNYIFNELFTGLSTEIQEFLMFTSVFDNITPEACNYILDSQDAEYKLKYVEKQNLFIIAVNTEDITTYRYHHIFKEFLLGLLSSRKSGVFDKAGKYYLQCGAFEQAFEYFRLAGNDVMLVSTVEKAGQQMLQQGRLKTIEGWLSILTERGLLKSPELLMLKGELLSYGGSFAEAEEFIDNAFNLFKENGSKTGLVRAAIHKARILRYRVSFAESTRFINEFIKDMGELPPGYSIEMAVEKVYSQWLMGDIKGAIDTAETALRSKDSRDNRKTTERLFGYMTVLYAIQGMYTDALKLYEEIMDSNGGNVDALEQGSIPLYVAVVHRERGDIDKALRILEESVSRKQSVGFTEDLHLIYFNIAVTLLNYGDNKEIDYYCKLAGEAFIKTGGHLEYYEVMLKAFQSAVAAYFSGEASKEAETLMEQTINSLRGKSAYLLAYISPYFVLYYLKYKRYKKADELLKLVIPISEAIGIRFHISILSGLKAVVLDAWHDSEGVIENAKRSIKLAAEERYERFFTSFPELLPCIKIAIVNGMEPQFTEVIIEKMDSQAAAPLLLELIRHPDPKVRERAVKLMKKGHFSQMINEIALFFFEEDEVVRETGFTLLQEITNDGKQICTKLFVQCMGSFKVYSCSDWKNPVLWRTTKAKELFAYLLHWKGQPVSSERILADLWPDLNIEKARNLFHTNLTYIRNFLNLYGLKENLYKSQNGYVLNMEGIVCDVWLHNCSGSGIYMEDIYSDWPYGRRVELEHDNTKE